MHSIYLALRGEQVDGYAYKLDKREVELGKVLLFDAEQHNPRNNPELFEKSRRCASSSGRRATAK